jgi:hypothetical protein
MQSRPRAHLETPTQRRSRSRTREVAPAEFDPRMKPRGRISRIMLAYTATDWLTQARPLPLQTMCACSTPRGLLLAVCS